MENDGVIEACLRGGSGVVSPTAQLVLSMDSGDMHDLYDLYNKGEILASPLSSPSSSNPTPPSMVLHSRTSRAPIQALSLAAQPFNQAHTRFNLSPASSSPSHRATSRITSSIPTPDFSPRSFPSTQKSPSPTNSPSLSPSSSPSPSPTPSPERASMFSVPPIPAFRGPRSEPESGPLRKVPRQPIAPGAPLITKGIRLVPSFSSSAIGIPSLSSAASSSSDAAMLSTSPNSTITSFLRSQKSKHGDGSPGLGGKGGVERLWGKVRSYSDIRTSGFGDLVEDGRKSARAHALTKEHPWGSELGFPESIDSPSLLPSSRMRMPILAESPTRKPGDTTKTPLEQDRMVNSSRLHSVLGTAPNPLSREIPRGSRLFVDECERRAEERKVDKPLIAREKTHVPCAPSPLKQTADTHTGVAKTDGDAVVIKLKAVDTIPAHPDPTEHDADATT
eukprot:TRINITY_DN5143_c0_g1_i4.p1 TRINITY_DN5143_c0_g1~~TRINITY_DN5143_c0_g1_i4.p1  ORF type:complete len:448 (-),score=99.45 TRINITY_DN5143_c0_g1_i4:124-1467(-)